MPTFLLRRLEETRVHIATSQQGVKLYIPKFHHDPDPFAVEQLAFVGVGIRLPAVFTASGGG